MTPEQAAAETGDGNTSAMVEIGRVYLRFAAACRGMVPLGAIFAFFLVNACVNRRSGRPLPSQKTGRSAVCRHRHRGCPTHASPGQLKG